MGQTQRPPLTPEVRDAIAKASRHLRAALINLNQECHGHRQGAAHIRTESVYRAAKAAIDDAVAAMFPPAELPLSAGVGELPGLSQTTMNSLTDAGVLRLQALVAMTRDDLRRDCRGMTPAKLSEIETALAAVGLRLAMPDYAR